MALLPSFHVTLGNSAQVSATVYQGTSSSKSCWWYLPAQCALDSSIHFLIPAHLGLKAMEDFPTTYPNLLQAAEVNSLLGSEHSPPQNILICLLWQHLSLVSKCVLVRSCHHHIKIAQWLQIFKSPRVFVCLFLICLFIT